MVNNITLKDEQYHYGVNCSIVFVNNIIINLNRITKVKIIKFTLQKITQKNLIIESNYRENGNEE